MHLLPRHLLLAIAPFLASVLAPAATADRNPPPQGTPPALHVRTGQIEGAKFALAVPDPWNLNVLLLAHGYRPESAPLSAEVPLDDPAYARLLAEGWIVATTSYRRNGILIRDAIADIDNLRDHLVEELGAPSLVVLLGESMGGAIVTLMAENEPGRFQGAVAIGAALNVRDAVYPLALTHGPKIPLLFLTNRSELEGPANYVAQAAEAPVPPALWTVARDGHVNVNHAERAWAIDALVNWITTSQIKRERDATVKMEAGTSGVTFSAGAAHGAVGSVTEGHGNIFSTFRPADLAALGLRKGEHFRLEAGGGEYRVFYGSDYGDVPRGEWVAFDRAEGVVLIARNLENAARTAGVSPGDPLTIRRLE